MHTCTHAHMHTHTHTHTRTHRFEADLDDYSIIMLKALADRLAEVTVELVEEDMADYVLHFNTHCMCSKPPPPLGTCFVEQHCGADEGTSASSLGPCNLVHYR